MAAAVSSGRSHRNFNIWVYSTEKLVRGSGLFVGETGVEANHHFLAPRNAGSVQCTSEVNSPVRANARHLAGDCGRAGGAEHWRLF
jgi:hypothetical protein